MENKQRTWKTGEVNDQTPSSIKTFLCFVQFFIEWTQNILKPKSNHYFLDEDQCNIGTKLKVDEQRLFHN